MACLLLACLACQVVAACTLVASSRAGAFTAVPLDMTGSIAIGDPFGACHADSYDVMAELGVKMNRKDITWTEVEPSDNTWNWAGWDARIASLKQKNMTALPILDYGNLAVQTGTTHGNRIHTEHDLQKWLRYVNMCVERYHVNDSGFVDHWEIWNEANLGEFNASQGFWTGTDEEFFELQKRTAANLSAQYPGLTILSNGISGHDPAYLDAMFSYGAMEGIDVLAFHPYSGTSYDSLAVKINEVKAVCRRHGFDGRLWITEVGMSTQFDPTVPGYKARYQESLELQASLVPKIYAISLANGIEHVTWYCLEDFNRGGDHELEDWRWGEANFGLVFAGSNTHKPDAYMHDTIKPAGYAYKALSGVLNWSTHVPRGVQKVMPLPSLEKIEAYYFMNGRRQLVLVAWNLNGQLPANISFPLPATASLDVFSGPSYKPGEATGYSTRLDGDTLLVEATVSASPHVFVITVPAGMDPFAIILSGSWGLFDTLVAVLLPAASATAVIVVAVRTARLRTRREK